MLTICHRYYYHLHGRYTLTMFTSALFVSSTSLVGSAVLVSLSIASLLVLRASQELSFNGIRSEEDQLIWWWTVQTKTPSYYTTPPPSYTSHSIKKTAPYKILPDSLYNTQYLYNTPSLYNPLSLELQLYIIFISPL